MAIGLIIYLIFAMVLANAVVHQQNQPTAWPTNYPFYLSFFRFLALSLFVLFSYPILFRLDPSNSWLNLSSRLSPVPEVLGGFSLMVISVAALAAIAAKLPFPPAILLLQGVIFSTWLFSRVATAEQSPTPLWPAWQFIGASLVVYGACLLLADITLWALNAQRIISTELSRLLAVLPALLIYCLGLSTAF